jgi:hypothetical protein
MQKQQRKNKPRNKQTAATKKVNTHLHEPKTKAKAKVIKELAVHFEEDLNKSMPISIQPDGSIVYKKYLIKQLANKSWGLYHIQSRDLVETFYLKTSALLAAKAYSSTFLDRYFEIKRLDSGYWANFMQSEISRSQLKSPVDLSRYIIILNKFEDSLYETERYKTSISTMFRNSFV